jgi:hypothetical protein
MNGSTTTVSMGNWALNVSNGMDLGGEKQHKLLFL